MITQYPVRTIDLAVLRQNVRLICSSLPAGVQLMAVVKADAYGHGIVKTARNAVAAGASWLAVARTDEGIALRNAGVTAPVLVLGAASGLEIGDAVRHELTVAVTDPRMICAAQRWTEREGKAALIHLKIDTGMGRIGIRTSDEVVEILHTLQDCPNVKLTGVFTHFADADSAQEEYTRLQLERFQTLSALLPKHVIRHCANSAAIHRFPEAAMDMVRAGISMYGYPPVRTDLPLRPVMDWKTAVTYVKTIHQGDKLSYGGIFTANCEMTVATVACGYGDGYHRCSTGKAEVIIHGARCPVVGRICMDQMMVDVSALEDVAPGDEAVLIGSDKSSSITAEELAVWADTISYEVLLAATERVHRRWINDCEE